MDELKVSTSMPDKQQLIYMIYLKKKMVEYDESIEQNNNAIVKKKR